MITDELWDEIYNILPKEKISKTVGRPIVPFRKVFDNISYIKNWMSMENGARRLWFWFYLPS
jgi:hypothetical protein